MDSPKNDLSAEADPGEALAIAFLDLITDVKEDGETLLHNASKTGDAEYVRFLVTELPKKSIWAQLNKFNQTALHLAADGGHIEVTEILINAAKYHSTVSSYQAFLRKADQDSDTALHTAVKKCHMNIVKLLVEADPSDRHIQNTSLKTPIYIAAEQGHIDIVKVICTTCTDLSFDGPNGATALHVAIQNLDQGKEKYREVVTELINAAKHCWSSGDESISEFEDLFNRTDSAYKTVLDLAVEGNHIDIVELILSEDPAYQHGRQNKIDSLRNSIHTAANEGYNDILKLLSDTYIRTSIAPEGLMALFVAIIERNKESVLRQLEVAKGLAICADYKGWTPLHCATFYEFDSVLDAIVEAQEDGEL